MKTKTKLGIVLWLSSTAVGIVFIYIAFKVNSMGVFEKIGRIAVGLAIIAIGHFLTKLLVKKPKEAPPAPAPAPAPGPQGSFPEGEPLPPQEGPAPVPPMPPEDAPQVPPEN